MTGSTACLDCTAGFYQPSTASTTCLACDAGTYQASAGAIACDPCTPGSFQPSPASIDCLNCPAGTAQGSAGSIACDPCAPGQFQPSLGSSACLNCAPGTYQAAAGSIGCNACAAGTYQPSLGSSSCLGCMAGTYADTAGSVFCTGCTPTCPAGQYQSAACTATSDTGCDVCDPSCLTCSGPTTAECTSCASGNPPVGGECLAGCAAGPLAGCRLPVVSGKSRLGIKDKAPDTKDALKWTWVKGADTTLGELGAPDTTDGYFLCVYDAGVRVSSMALPAGGVCAGKPCWKAKSTGFVYKDKELTPDGAQSAILKAGLAAKASMKVRGKGANLETPNPAGFTGPITVQLQRADGAICFETTFSAPFKKNEGGSFADVAD
jgi:hypothetical protein